MTMWFLLLVIHAMSAAPQLKYVESAIHFDPKADNSTATINNQEKAAALNSIYHNHAELAHAAHADQADDEDCCCSLPVHTVDHSSPGLRIVNRPPPNKWWPLPPSAPSASPAWAAPPASSPSAASAPPASSAAKDLPAFGLLQEEVSAGAKIWTQKSHITQPRIDQLCLAWADLTSIFIDWPTLARSGTLLLQWMLWTIKWLSARHRSVHWLIEIVVDV